MQKWPPIAYIPNIYPRDNLGSARNNWSQTDAPTEGSCYKKTLNFGMSPHLQHSQTTTQHYLKSATMHAYKYLVLFAVLISGVFAASIQYPRDNAEKTRRGVACPSDCNWNGDCCSSACIQHVSKVYWKSDVES